jgi:nicotinate (nicotinamide) nucleotide adenylyltransferase
MSTRCFRRLADVVARRSSAIHGGVGRVRASVRTLTVATPGGSEATVSASSLAGLACAAAVATASAAAAEFPRPSRAAEARCDARAAGKEPSELLRRRCQSLGAIDDVTKRRRVAILGGAFDPITNSHLTCASEIVRSGQADEVWLVPCGPRPDKPGLKTPVFDRYCMCQIAVNTVFTPGFPVKVSDAEVHVDEAAFTYDLLTRERDNHPDTDFVFIIGSDWLQPNTDLTKWNSLNTGWKPGMPEAERTIITGHKMIQEFDFLVLERPGCEVPSTPEDPTGLKKFGPRLFWLSMPDKMTFIEGNLSSTEIRKRWARKPQLDSIDGLVPPGVLGYICRRGLYQSK